MQQPQASAQRRTLPLQLRQRAFVAALESAIGVDPRPPHIEHQAQVPD
jgi:hypothetical protein